MDDLMPALASHYALDTFQTDLHSVCGQFQIAPHEKRQSLNAHLSVRQYPGLDLANVGLDAQKVVRTKQDIRYDPGDHFFLILQREGHSVLHQNEITATVNPGDMFLVDSTRESQFYYGGDYSLQLSVHLPRQEMTHRFGRRIQGGICISRTDALGLSLKALLARLCAEPEDPQSHVVEAFYSVFGAVLIEREKGSSDTHNPDRKIVQRALSIMSDNYDTAEFNTSDLADLTGVSLRRLQRAFALIGQTPHQRLQATRVAAAHAALTSGTGTGTSVSNIAYSHGFADLSTFYRIYRKTYGIAPGSHLEQDN